jgi:hypothetical protein
VRASWVDDTRWCSVDEILAGLRNLPRLETLTFEDLFDASRYDQPRNVDNLLSLPRLTSVSGLVFSHLTTLASLVLGLRSLSCTVVKQNSRASLPASV